MAREALLLLIVFAAACAPRRVVIVPFPGARPLEPLASEWCERTCGPVLRAEERVLGCRSVRLGGGMPRELAGHHEAVSCELY